MPQPSWKSTSLVATIVYLRWGMRSVRSGSPSAGMRRRVEMDNNVCTAVSGSAETMPPPGLCRVLPLLTQPAGFLTIPDAA